MQIVVGEAGLRDQPLPPAKGQLERQVQLGQEAGPPRGVRDGLLHGGRHRPAEQRRPSGQPGEVGPGHLGKPGAETGPFRLIRPEVQGTAVGARRQSAGGEVRAVVRRGVHQPGIRLAEGVQQPEALPVVPGVFEQPLVQPGRLPVGFPGLAGPEAFPGFIPLGRPHLGEEAQQAPLRGVRIPGGLQRLQHLPGAAQVAAVGKQLRQVVAGLVPPVARPRLLQHAPEAALRLFEPPLPGLDAADEPEGVVRLVIRGGRRPELFEQPQCLVEPVCPVGFRAPIVNRTGRLLGGSARCSGEQAQPDPRDDPRHPPTAFHSASPASTF